MLYAGSIQNYHFICIIHVSALTLLGIDTRAPVAKKRKKIHCIQGSA